MQYKKKTHNNYRKKINLMPGFITRAFQSTFIKKACPRSSMSENELVRQAALVDNPYLWWHNSCMHQFRIQFLLGEVAVQFKADQKWLKTRPKEV